MRNIIFQKYGRTNCCGSRAREPTGRLRGTRGAYGMRPYYLPRGPPLINLAFIIAPNNASLPHQDLCPNCLFCSQCKLNVLTSMFVLIISISTLLIKYSLFSTNKSKKEHFKNNKNYIALLHYGQCVWPIFTSNK